MIKKSIQALVIVPFTFSSLLGLGSNDNLLLASHEMSLGNRYPNSSVNDVFKDNILLNLAYLGDKISSPKDINWEKVTKPFQYEFKLEPYQTFAFHSDVSEKYRNSLAKTTNAHFNAAEGFKSDGYLFGDGVCHLASLINWVATEAGLKVEVPTNHNFANIPDVPKKYGVSIYANPYSKGANTMQNLYITNNKGKPISFRFEYSEEKVKVSVVELN